MFKALFAAAIGQMLIFSSAALAETKTYNVEGMHCENCAANIKAKVCALEGVEKCEVEVGKVTLTTKGDAKLDDGAVTTAVQAAGYNVVGTAKSDIACSHDGKKSCDKHHKGHKAKKKGA
jgi:periplasmic mercuric ion binding protein